MAGVKLVVALLLLVYVSWAGALVHHVVGGDRGWDTSSDIEAWLSNKVFRVGDKIWFIYSGGQEGVVELKSREEFDSCDVSNPIRTYTEGLDAVLMGSEGIRFFTSSKPKSCKDGLRLLVEVQSNREIKSDAKSETATITLAAGPISFSAGAPAATTLAAGPISSPAVGLAATTLADGPISSSAVAPAATTLAPEPISPSAATHFTCT
ncbi:Uclacyanin 1 [Vitis vinifera]|uniref:Uclacyanin 1 n=1 Tax=Vitis vinifera TaxID=29760 RepID=A0A438JGL6_VITVI|nr:Uclacyanin 1 [Vitis vinifera]